MTKIRVLLVDDAAIVRRVVADVLAEDPELELAGFASDGRMGLERVEALDPDVVLLDLDMPVMDGLEMLTELRERHPRLPVLVYSALVQDGEPVTLRALWLGANDVVPKPTGGLAATRLLLRTQVLPRLKSLAARPEVDTDTPPTRAGVARGRIARRAEVVAIGASTGGPRALAAVLGALPASFAVPIVAVQHMPHPFTTYFAEGLAARIALPVREARDGERLEPGCVLLAPGGRHLVIRGVGLQATAHLVDDPPVHGCRPSLDPLLRSLAESHEGGVLAVVLTGMGGDGLDGCRAVRARGGAVVVQDRVTSVVWGMPGLVAEAGLADAVLPLDRIAGEIVRRVAVSDRGRAVA